MESQQKRDQICPGKNLFFLQQGNRGERILFLHGLGSSSNSWRLQFEFFSPSYRILAPDFLGHGKSDKPDQEYSVAAHAEDILALLDLLSIDSVHVVGLSMGGMVAFQLAVDAPQRLKSMTIVNAGPVVPLENFQVRMLLWSRLAIIHTLGMKKMGQIVAQRLFPEKGQEELLQTAAKQVGSNPKSIYLRNMKCLFGWGVEDKLPEIGVPTLVVSADMDYTTVEFKQQFVDKMRNARLAVVKNSHHFTPLDQPDAFNRLVDDFIKSNA